MSKDPMVLIVVPIVSPNMSPSKLKPVGSGLLMGSLAAKAYRLAFLGSSGASWVSCWLQRPRAGLYQRWPYLTQPVTRSWIAGLEHVRVLDVPSPPEFAVMVGVP